MIAGEASGDHHAARLANALRELAPQIEWDFFGATGQKMRRAGIETIVRSDNLSIVGLPEIARELPMFWKVFQKLKREAKWRRPDIVVLIDFPEFNLKLAKSLKNQGLKIVYYISPQIWAWRSYRLRAIKRDVDLLLTILPFEEDWYRRRGFEKVKFIGNPLAREVNPHLSREEFCKKHDLDLSKPIVSLLPGSRSKEIERILPVLLETAELMQKANPDLQFVVALAENRKFSEVESAENKFRLNNLLVVRGETHEALNASDVAAVTSGTATLETAIIGTPFAIVYKTSAFNWFLFRPIISVEHFGLVNLIAGRRLVKELIHKNFTAADLSRELFRLLETENNNKMRSELKETAATLGHGGASKRAATAIMELTSIHD